MARSKTTQNNTKKKSALYAERDEQKRQSYLTEVAKYDVEKLVYIDESGIDKFICREHGWNVRGEKVRSEVSGRRYARESFIAGLIGNKVIAPLCYTGTCDSGLFNFWLENFLLPTLEPGHTIIMDNAAFHKSEQTKVLINNAGCTLIFLPPYSPDMNPIEKFWANLKAKIKKVVTMFTTLAQAIDYVFQSII
jgi:transposase